MLVSCVLAAALFGILLSPDYGLGSFYPRYSTSSAIWRSSAVYPALLDSSSEPSGAPSSPGDAQHRFRSEKATAGFEPEEDSLRSSSGIQIGDGVRRSLRSRRRTSRVASLPARHTRGLTPSDLARPRAGVEAVVVDVDGLAVVLPVRRLADILDGAVGGITVIASRRRHTDAPLADPPDCGLSAIGFEHLVRSQGPDLNRRIAALQAAA